MSKPDKSEIQDEAALVMRELVHELSTYVSLIGARSLMARNIANDETVRNELSAILAMCSRIGQIISRYRHYFLTSGSIENPPRRSLRLADILGRVKDIASDYQLLASSSRTIEIDIAEETAESPKSILVSGDLDLIEQALANIIDNAVKYSFPDSVIKISAGRTNDELVISVSNRGLEMTISDVEQSRTRGWRGEHASLVAGGWGLGLWIANSVASAHQGRLDIAPTTGGITRVSLSLPLEGPER